MRKMCIAAFALSLVAAASSALDLGDKAPEISPEAWVTGSPADPTQADGDAIYLVEVWSVTCPPCVRSIPILNDLQRRYADKGFKIVSFTSDEIDQVKKFLGEHPMEYSSFIDAEGATYIRYMAADNRNTIPHAFLFDKSGSLVWIGNPLDNLESRVKQVLDGTLNRETAIAVRDARQQLQSAFEEQNIGDMLAALNRLETIEPGNGQYYQLHYRILSEVGDEADLRKLLDDWYRASQDQPESLILLSLLAMEQGHPRIRNPELALAAARRAAAVAAPETRIEAGLNLADIYRSISRVDLSLATVRELSGNASPDEVDILSSLENYYTRILDLSKNPDAKYEP